MFHNEITKNEITKSSFHTTRLLRCFRETCRRSSPVFCSKIFGRTRLRLYKEVVALIQIRKILFKFFVQFHSGIAGQVHV